MISEDALARPVATLCWCICCLTRMMMAGGSVSRRHGGGAFHYLANLAGSPMAVVDVPIRLGPLDRTVDFLRRTQHVRDYWDEPPGSLSFNPPSWMVPGNHAKQLWLTSVVCCKLLELGRQADVRFEVAVEFLRSSWE